MSIHPPKTTIELTFQYALSIYDKKVKTLHEKIKIRIFQQVT